MLGWNSLRTEGADKTWRHVYAVELGERTSCRTEVSDRSGQASRRLDKTGIKLTDGGQFRSQLDIVISLKVAYETEGLCEVVMQEKASVFDVGYSPDLLGELA